MLREQEKDLKPKKKKNMQPSERARKFLKNKIAGMNHKQAALAAGYAETTSDNAKAEIFDQPGVQAEWQRILAKAGLTDNLLAKKLKEGLEATKIHGTTEDFIEVPDYSTQHKYLETALTQKGHTANNQSSVQLIFFNNIKEERQVYNVND